MNDILGADNPREPRCLKRTQLTRDVKNKTRTLSDGGIPFVGAFTI